MHVMSDAILGKRREELHERGVRVTFAGRRDWRVPKRVLRHMEEVAELTRHNRRMTFCIAFNYGGRAEIVDAVRALVAEGVDASPIDERAISSHLYQPGMPEPDLVIRTCGEFRISNFWLWEIAYSELVFSDTLWPDFRREHLFEAVREYQRRERRFGELDAALRHGRLPRPGRRAAHLQVRRGRPHRRRPHRGPRQGPGRRQGRAQDQEPLRVAARADQPRQPPAVRGPPERGGTARHDHPGRHARAPSDDASGPDRLGKATAVLEAVDHVAQDREPDAAALPHGGRCPPQRWSSGLPRSSWPPSTGSCWRPREWRRWSMPAPDAAPRRTWWRSISSRGECCAGRAAPGRRSAPPRWRCCAACCR